jgi:hypothetical protein
MYYNIILLIYDIILIYIIFNNYILIIFKYIYKQIICEMFGGVFITLIFAYPIVKKSLLQLYANINIYIISFYKYIINLYKYIIIFYNLLYIFVI